MERNGVGRAVELPLTQLWSLCTRKTRSHSQGPRTLVLRLCGTARARGLVYAPPRLSVRVCESVWRGQRRTLCSGRGQRPGAKLGIVSSCLGQMLPGNRILNPVLNFLGTWDVVKTLSPANRPSQIPWGVDLNPQPCAGAGQPANFPRLEAWGVYTRQPHAPGLGRTQASGGARGEAAQRRQAAPASRLAKFGLGGLPIRSGSAGQGPLEPRALASTVPRKAPHSARVTHPNRGARRRGLCPGALATGRTGRPWPRAGGRPGRGARRTGGRLSAPQPRAPAPVTPRAHASGLRCLRAAGCRAQAARASPGHRERSNAAGAERSASRAAHRASRRAEPAAGERAGGRRKTRTGATELGGVRAGRGKEGGAQQPRAARTGHPQLWGSLSALPEAPPGRGWGGGREASHLPARSPGTGQKSETRSGSILRIRVLPGPPASAQVAREGPRAAAIPARRQAADSGQGQRCPAAVPRSPLPSPHPTPHLPAALRGVHRVAVRHPARGSDRGLREALGPWPASRGTRVGQTRGHPQSQPRYQVGLRVILGFSNPTAPFT